MLLEEQIREVFQYQVTYYSQLSTGIQRTVLDDIDLSGDHVKIISGIRRCGKSTLLRQLASRLHSPNFLSFEDPRLAGFEVNDFFKLEKVFQEKDPSGSFFFDEIQLVKGWEQYIRVLHDKKVRVALSGSNASLLSRELGTSLTGRQITYELFPFSYAEYLRIRSVMSGVESFADYLDKGGFPEYLQSGDPDVLVSLYNDLIYRDIIVRHGLRNTQLVRELGVYLATNTGKEFSYNRLTSQFDLGSVNTTQSYLGYFEDAYLFFIVPRFSFSLRSQAKSPKKVYGIDTGLTHALSLSFSKDQGRMLENAVFLELKRKGKQVFYFRAQGECDFVAVSNRTIETLIQVCLSLDHDTLKRELSGITEAMDALKVSSGLILTMNQEDRIVRDNKTIVVQPAWKWMLQ